MRRALLSLLIGAALLAGIPAQAFWQSRDSNYNQSASAGAAYVGPGDIVTGVTVAYLLRAYTAAIAAAGTQKLVNLQRSSDSQICDILVATSGGMGLTANCSGAAGGVSAAVFCAATTCSVLIWYDQSGNGFNAVPPATAPTLSVTGLNSLPSVVYAGSAGLLNQNNVGSAATGSHSAVAIRTGSFTSFSGIGTTQPWQLFFSNSANSISFFGNGTGIIAAAANDSTAHSVDAVGNGASSFLTIDATKTTGSPGVGSTGSNIGVGSQFNGSSNLLTGSISEELYYNGVAFTPTQDTNMQANKKAYWGTP